MGSSPQNTAIDRVTEIISKALSGVDLGDQVFRVSVEEVLPSTPPSSSSTDTGHVSGPTLRICKSDDSEERYVLGIVLEPDTVDSQGDIYTAETIRESAYRFMEEYQNVGLQHSGLINDKVKILESWIQREDTVIGGQTVKAGTWLLAVHVVDDDIWARVKDGRITGFSIGGRAKRTEIV